MNHAQFWGGGGAAPYEIGNSLRFRGTGQYLSRTQNRSGQANFTFSAWVKVSKLGNFTNPILVGGAYPSGNNCLEINNDKINIAANKGINGTGATFNNYLRDPSAWYHIVMRLVGNTITVWINGVEASKIQQVGSWPNNFNNGGQIQGIGSGYGNNLSAETFYGYIAEAHFVDSQALTPTDFGEYDDNGVWRPIEYTGSYNTNGFYLKFDPTATNGIGHDHSGNGNNWSPSGFTTSGTGTDVMSDTPTNNWCTLNPLAFQDVNYKPTISEGSLRSSGTSARSYGTIAIPSSGKYYFEGQATTVGTSTAQFGIYAARWGSTGQLNYLNTSGTFTQASIATYSNQTLGIAVNVDDGEVTFYKNNTSVGTTSVSTMAGTLPFFNHGGNWTWTLNFGQRAFAYTPPTGYKALNTANLPAPPVKDGGDHFNTVLWTGNGGVQSVSGVGFQPDMTWVKSRSISAEHWINDAVRGAGYSLPPSNTYSEQNYQVYFTSFNSDGFSLAQGTSSFNQTSATYVGWNWKANGAGSTNNAGTITSTVSANPTAGFSIITYSGNSTNNSTIGHGLGVAPAMIITKLRTGASNEGWPVWHKTWGNTQYLQLNQTSGNLGTDSNIYGGSNNTAPTSTVYSVGAGGVTNTSGRTYVAYCFSEVEGYSKFGSCGSNNNTDGNFVYTGFSPAFVMVKSLDGHGGWMMYDTTRMTFNPGGDASTAYPLSADRTYAESAFWNGYQFDILSNGFKLRSNQGDVNYSGNYIFAAFAEHPTGGDGVSPATAR